MVGGNAPAGQPVQKDGDAQRLGERQQLGLAMAPVQVGPGHDHRALGATQQLAGAFDRSAVGATGGAGGQALEHVVRLGSLHENVVQGEVHERGPAVGSKRGGERLVDEAGNLCGALGGDRELGQGADERDVVDLLQRAHPPASGGGAPAEDDHRRVVGLCGAHRAHAIGDAGSGRERADAGLARDLRPALGGERGRGLMADVDDVDPLLATAVVDREQVSAGEREQPADAVRP